MTYEKSSRLIIGIDIGGTKIAAGVVDANLGQMVLQARETTPAGGNIPILRCTGNLVEELMARAHQTIDGIGIGIPGTVERIGGIAVHAGNLDFDHMPIKSYIEDRFGIACHLENDTNAGALGEKWFGTGRSLENFVYLAIGTGIGAGFILKNKLYMGMGDAAEVGHMTVDSNSTRVCYCGLPGCLEVLASGTAIAKKAFILLKNGSASSLKEIWEREEMITAEDVVEAAIKGDQMALDVMREAGRYIAYSCINLIRLLDPEGIILGGGVSQSGQFLKDIILSEAPKSGIRNHLDELINFAGVNSGIIGAASVFLERESDMK